MKGHAGKPGERKWGHPPKGSRGYGNQVKGKWGHPPKGSREFDETKRCVAPMKPSFFERFKANIAQQGTSNWPKPRPHSN
ncbi:hypothetical protein Scep_029532 [Stephania cephalantha]|uniref:Uncharacterized protein n=1 Tax=Stephania cephalantha TaxID=152367 RepID=A0AAP0DY14_9MAGN